MIKVSVLPWRRSYHGWSVSARYERMARVPAHGRVSLKLRQFASPNERCSVESAPHQIVKECSSYHDNIRVGNADPLSWTK